MRVIFPLVFATIWTFLFGGVHGWSLVHRRLMAAGASLVLVTASPAPQEVFAAIEGAPPKMEFFKSESPISMVTGPALYDLSEKQMLNDKVKRIEAQFNAMTEKVDRTSTLSRQDAQGVISNYMGYLKTDMRTVTKSLLGGDILQRQSSVGLSGTREAMFDYNSGQFALLPLAADTETIVAEINDLYFNTLPNAPLEQVHSEIIAIDSLFKDWLKLAKGQLD